MTQEERWMQRYNEALKFIEVNKAESKQASDRGT